jgi:hypothetical protein
VKSLARWKLVSGSSAWIRSGHLNRLPNFKPSNLFAQLPCLIAPVHWRIAHVHRARGGHHDQSLVGGRDIFAWCERSMTDKGILGRMPTLQQTRVPHRHTKLIGRQLPERAGVRARICL